MTCKPVALWAVPRSVSTALERVFVERGDFEVFHEPFSVSYYYSPSRRSDRFAGTEPKEEYEPNEVLARLLGRRGKPVFLKDMASHVAGFMSRKFVSEFTNTFIIREPAPVIASIYGFWPDFTFEEAGYEQQHRLFGLAVENGEDPAVVDASDLTANPEGTIRAYCEKLGVPFMPEALSWEPGTVPGWEMWSEWHREAQESTGIKDQPLEDDTEVPAGLEDVYERCLPYYEELYERSSVRPARLVPTRSWYSVVVVALVLYDLDNTLLAGDSEHAWCEFLVDAGVLDGEDARAENERLYGEYEAGTLDIHESLKFQLEPLIKHPPEALRRWRKEFMSSRIEPMITDAAVDLVEGHRDAGGDLAIVTASNSFVSEPIADRFGIPSLLSVELEHHQHRYTGRVLGTPTFREGKVKRLVEWMRKTGRNLAGSHFYTDSHNDLPLLELVDNPVAVNPDPVLGAHAEAREWPVLRLDGGASGRPA